MQEYIELLQAWLIARGVPPGTGDAQWNLLFKIARSYGAIPSPGDTIADLWEKIRIAVGDTSCRCGDNAWQSARRILDILAPGSFAQGDSEWDLLRKIVDAVS